MAYRGDNGKAEIKLLSKVSGFVTRPKECPYAVAAAPTLLMIVGIHNAWDVAVFNSVSEKNEKPEKRKT